MEYVKGDVLDGSFEVRDVKKGGFGIVYISHNRELGQRFGIVAIKSFQDKFFYQGDKRADDVIEAFYREAETWVKLERHQNIVKAEYVKEIDYKPHIFLEYVDGGNLEERLERGRLSIPETLFLAIQICHGMIYANSKDLGEGTRGIVHRDIKPANIMLTKDGILKITDFGLVKALGPPMAEKPMGTPEYMSPEQFRRMDVDTRSDIYSFGVILYEMLTERPPFYTEIEEERWNYCKRHHQEVSPKWPSLVNPLVPEELEQVVLKCLAKHPENRYQSFDDLREILVEIYQRFFGERPEIKERIEILTAEEWINKGASLAALGKHVDAIQCYEKALGMLLPFSTYLHITNGDLFRHQCKAVWNNKGVSLDNLGRFEEAQQCYDRALEIDPRSASTWRNKGLLFSRSGKFEDAIECFDKALQINPGKADVWNHKGASLDKLGRFEEAVQCYEKTLQINPRHAEAGSNKGASLLQAGRFEDALKCFKRALQINPRSGELWSNVGVSLAKLGRFEEAIESFDRALQINPKCAQAWLNKGTYLNELGEQEGPLQKLDRALESIKCLDRALEIDSTIAEAWLQKGLQLSLLGKFDEALQCFDEALKIDPNMELAKKGKEAILKLKRQARIRPPRGPDSYINL